MYHTVPHLGKSYSRPSSSTRLELTVCCTEHPTHPQRSTPRTLQNFSATRPRSKRELEIPSGIIYPISRLLIIRIDVREPADAASHNTLQVDAVLVQEIVVGLRDEPSKKVCFTTPIQRYRGGGDEEALTSSLAMDATASGLFG